MIFPQPAPIDDPPRQNDSPVFLHTGWRSRGTWIWTGLRSDPRALALYEPLHEVLATLTPQAITALRTDSWSSGHAAMPPYWSEFAALLRPGVVGVPGYQYRFATEDAFAGPARVQPGLAAYLRGLLDHAAAARRVPVLKFCRSMGRVAWMQASFPEALHVVVLRRPDAQWASIRHQIEAHANPYFMVMLLVVLAQNAAAPRVAQACQALRVALPQVRRGNLGRAIETCDEMMRQLSWADCYRSFLAYWVACVLSDLGTDCLMVEADMLLRSAECRQDMAALFARRSGLCLALQADPSRSDIAPSALGREEQVAQRAAMELLQEHRMALRLDGYLLAWNLLAAGLAGPDPTAMHDNESSSGGPEIPAPGDGSANPGASAGLWTCRPDDRAIAPG